MDQESEKCVMRGEITRVVNDTQASIIKMQDVIDMNGAADVVLASMCFILGRNYSALRKSRVAVPLNRYLQAIKENVIAAIENEESQEDVP